MNRFAKSRFYTAESLTEFLEQGDKSRFFSNLVHSTINPIVASRSLDASSVASWKKKDWKVENL